MLIDEIQIKVKAGKGGDGCVAFDTSKGGRGPTGGTGGKGGDVYFKATSDLSALNKFRFQKDFAAEDGEGGKNKLMDGKSGKDLVLEVPIGTVARNLSIGKEFELTKPGETVIMARGGKGGRGNWFFRSSTNTTPKEWEKGLAGEEFEMDLELRLIAQIGLIGFPNAGKSSLLNALTKAEAKVASYPFTTLEPNLGDFHKLIIADIPGLIEEASEGKGLGTKFLRHIKRTNILLHCISSESQDPAKDYNIIRGELIKYSPEMKDKKEYIFLTKTDILSKDEIDKTINILKKINSNVMAVSIYDYESLEEVKKFLFEIKNELGL